MALFRWETLREIGPFDLNYRPPIPGRLLEVALGSGPVVLVWRADDGQTYFCHGLTFGGQDAPGGPVSPLTGRPVETILREYYQLVPEAEARPGDIVVWARPAPETTPHSAVLTDPVPAPDGTGLDDSSRLRTKNGRLPEAVMPLGELVLLYGETFRVYRER